MTAHLAGVPLEETFLLLPIAGTAVLLGRAWLTLHLRRLRAPRV